MIPDIRKLRPESPIILVGNDIGQRLKKMVKTLRHVPTNTANDLAKKLDVRYWEIDLLKNEKVRDLFDKCAGLLVKKKKKSYNPFRNMFRSKSKDSIFGIFSKHRDRKPKQKKV